jgi:serine/threonine-protein kinase
MTEQFERLKSALAERYAIEREIGSGGMATVYLAKDQRHGRDVAVKVLKPELALAVGPDRFLREIQITAGLEHPHILTLIDSGNADGFLYYVMPFIQGETLRDRMNTEGQLPMEDALRISREVADALDFAHERGVVHRDIKPDNILISGGHAAVMDFGIARAADVSDASGAQRMTETGLLLGTPAYMSPEQVAGDRELDGRSDIYSLACVLFEMLTGRPPFTGPTAQAVMTKRFVEPVPKIGKLRDQVPPSVEQAILKAMAPEPAER